MIELETGITAKLLELSRYAANGNDPSQSYDDLHPENDILVDPTTCQAPNIDDFIIANYLSEQREVKFQKFIFSSIFKNLQKFLRIILLRFFRRKMNLNLFLDLKDIMVILKFWPNSKIFK